MTDSDRIADLERISDMIRQGEPVGFFDAIAAIDYQDELRKKRETSGLWFRFKRWFLVTCTGENK